MSTEQKLLETQLDLLMTHLRVAGGAMERKDYDSASLHEEEGARVQQEILEGAQEVSEPAPEYQGNPDDVAFPRRIRPPLESLGAGSEIQVEAIGDGRVHAFALYRHDGSGDEDLPWCLNQSRSADPGTKPYLRSSEITDYEVIKAVLKEDA